MKNRTYLWLRLTFYIIEQSPSDYSRTSDVETLLKSLPEEHSQAYEKILEQKKIEAHPHPFSAYARRDTTSQR